MVTFSMIIPAGFALLLTPVHITGWQHMLMLVPLCLSISIVYKTIRCRALSEVPVASLTLCATIVLSMYAVGVGVWLLFLLLA